MQSLLLWQLISAILLIASCLSIVSVFRERKKINALSLKYAKIKRELVDYLFSNPNPIFGVDNHGIAIFANHGCEAIFTEWKVGLDEKIPPEWREIIRQVLLSKEPQNVELSYGDKNYLFCIVPRRNTQVSMFGMDITSLKKAERDLENRTLNDVHTNLPNRLGFNKNIEVLTNEAKTSKIKLSVLILRLDDYSQIVSTYGQEISDAIVLELSQRIVACSHRNSHIARLSDSQFGIIEPNMGEPSAIAGYVESLIRNCTSPYKVVERDVFVTISIGIAICPNDSDTPEKLIRNAQLAVNRTSSTRNAFEFFQRGMEEQLELRAEILSDLHIAVKEKQFEMHYQPQIDIIENRLIGCEALIRWKHPKKGFISPFYFITIAEESNLIETIGEWVLHETCRQIQEWQRQGIAPIKVAVNVSGRQMLKVDVVSLVSKAMTDYQVTPSWLSLELTESAMVEDKELAIVKMKGLKALGLDLALDDFGTGYSSLSYLSQFPIDKIKIDRSFVKVIDEMGQNNAVTKGIIDLGRQMNLHIVAEGVETKAQLEYLKNHGCDIIQGYIFGKPVPPSDFVKLFEKDWNKEIIKALDEPRELKESKN